MTHAASGTPSVPFHRNADYLRLIAAQGLSITGREIETVVLPLLVLAMTGSPTKVGLVAATQSLPYLLLSLPAGALVDRWDRKRVMIVCDAVRALAFASLPAAWLLGGLHMAQLYAVAAIAGSAFVFYNIAEISCLPRMVEPEELPRATATNTVVEWVGENAGPAVGGVLVGVGRTNLVGAMLAYAVQAGMLALSLIFLGAIRRPLQAPADAPSPAALRNLAKEIGEGVRWLLGHSEVRALALLAMALNVLFGPVTLGMIVMARDGFHAPPAAIGLMFSAGGVAGLASTIAAPWIREHVALGRIIVAGVMVWALGLAAIAGSGSMLALTAAWLILPGVSGVSEVATMSYRLSLIPQAMQGRVNSVFRFMAWGLRPATLALGGFAVATYGPHKTLWVLAAGMALTAVAVALGPLRKAR
jgi:MFS family permease